jgi:S-(hydroxymethyl)glutathione dehydrogenase/alcohol dehydrogenase
MTVRLKAAVLYEADRPLRIASGIEAPPVGPGQVAVRLAYAGVCHSQVMETRGRRGPDRYLPHLLGHEGSAIVVETGAGVEKVAAGQRVVLGWIKGRGAEVASTRYRLDGATLNAGAVTTFNDYALVSENRCVPVPEGVPMDVAALLGCAVPTGAGIVANMIDPKAGGTIAIIGLGGIGLSALLACRLYQFAEIIAVDIAPEKLALARELGATALIDARTQHSVEEIRHLTGGAGADHVIEAAGLAQTIEQAFEATRRGGLCIFASHPQSGARISIDPYELICGKRIIGSWGGGSDPDRDIPRFAGWYRSGRLPLESLITRRYRLDEINQALDDLEQHRVGRPLIEIDSSIG